MKAVYLALCLMIVLAGTVMAYDSWDDGYDDYYYDDNGYYYDDYGGAGCCCGPMFALLAVGAFAVQRRQ